MPRTWSLLQASGGQGIADFHVAVYGSQPYVLDFLQRPMEAVFEPSSLRVRRRPCRRCRRLQLVASALGYCWKQAGNNSPPPAQFIEARLDKNTAELAHNCRAVCLFVNDVSAAQG